MADGFAFCERVSVEAVFPCYPKELLVFLTLSILLWAPCGGLRKKWKCCVSQHILNCWASSHSACDSLFTLPCFFEAVTSLLCQRWSLCGPQLSLWTFIVLKVCFPLFCSLWVTQKYFVYHLAPFAFRGQAVHSTFSIPSERGLWACLASKWLQLVAIRTTQSALK